MEPCLICNKVFSSKNSLRSHRSRFHRPEKKILNNVNQKVLPTTFGSVITSRRDVNRTRYSNNQDNSSETENMEDIQKSKLIDKKLWQRPMTREETSGDSDIDSKQGYKRRNKIIPLYCL